MILVFFTGSVTYSQEALTGNKLAVRQQLDEQAKEFQKEVIRITDGVYHAVGFDGSNTAMIEGKDGLIIIDTLRSTEGAGSKWRIPQDHRNR
jgi:uncharacterized sulfatase